MKQPTTFMNYFVKACITSSSSVYLHGIHNILRTNIQLAFVELVDVPASF